jgi:putative glutathione S-transferase
MLNSEFNSFASNPSLDLYPEPLRAKIDELNDWIYNGINNGVYKCGFARSQTAYNEAFEVLFKCKSSFCSSLLTT